MPAHVLSSLEHTTLRERALEALRSAILSGRYRPADHLGEVELSSLLGVSRGTVREALRHLQQEGLVVAGSRGRMQVNSLSSRQIRELFEVRAALESVAVTSIIRSPRRVELTRQLRDALGNLDSQDAEDFAARVAADLAFHHLLCQLSGNTMLVDSWSHLQGRMQVAIINVTTERAPVMMSQSRHLPLVEAVEAGNVALAVAAVHDHMTSAAEHFTAEVA